MDQSNLIASLSKIKAELEQKVEILDNHILHLKARLMDKYLMAFEDGTPGEIYIATFKRRCINGLLDTITEQPDLCKDWLAHTIRRTRANILDGGFTEQSTSLFSNIAHTYKKEVACYTLKWYEKCLDTILEGETINANAAKN